MFIPLHDQNNEPVKIIPYVSYGLMVLTVLVFLFQELIAIRPDNEGRMFILRHGLVPAPVISGQTEYSHQLRVRRGRPVERSNPWNPGYRNRKAAPRFSSQYLHVENSLLWVYLMPITYIFLHGGWMHLLGNLWFFWIFSDNVEERLGWIFFLLFYLSAGVAGGFLHILFHAESTMPLVGASGAIAGLMGAYISLFPGNRITSYFCPVWFFIRRIDVPAWVVLGFFLLFNVMALYQADSLGSNVAFDCHVGGFLCGLLVGFVFKRRVAPRHTSQVAT